jgi:formylglycine-generating enzyme required for sulfatase activity
MNPLRHWLATGLLAALPIAAAAQTSTRDCAQCPELILLPAGSFAMGSSRDDVEFDVASGETPALTITLRKGFALGRFEVTRAEFAAYRAATGQETPQANASESRCARLLTIATAPPPPAAPMTCLSDEEIADYLDWLSERSGHRYRLPSESEWEYALRAGEPGARFWSNRDSHEGVSISRACDFANGYDVDARVLRLPYPHARCADGYVGLAPVGSFQANKWGLYDVHGNARERLADCFTRSYKGRPPDERPWLWSECRYQAVRGGSYLSRPLALRSAARDYIDRRSNDGRAADLGFRVARDLRAER